MGSKNVLGSYKDIISEIFLLQIFGQKNVTIKQVLSLKQFWSKKIEAQKISFVPQEKFSIQEKILNPKKHGSKTN